MKNKLIMLAMLGIFSANFMHSDEVEEVIVQASLLNVTEDEIGDPLHILSGSDVSDFGTVSLGEVLDSLVGVTSADYGSAVGQPIIRGLSGSRVKILTNGLVNRDVAGIGADHKNEVDLNDIQQIEVVRGPSSLLYANGITGGIVNIVDNTIAMEDVVDRVFKLGLETQSVNSGDTQSFSVKDNLGGLNVYFSYSDASFGNYDVPSGAILHEEEHDEDDDDHEDGDHDDHHDDDKGYLENSDSTQEATRFGVSKVADWGYVGLSVSSSESLFGIPFHGEEHDEEEHEGEHEDERIFSSTDSDKFNIKGSIKLDSDLVNNLDFFYQDSDYAHTEQHAEEEHGDEDHDDHGHGEEGPTTFTNDSSEYGMIFDLSNDLMTQKVSLNVSDEAVSIIGEEAFMNPADREELTLGYFARRDFDLFELSFGVRYDQIDTNGSVTGHHEEEEEPHDEEEEHEEETENYSFSSNNVSFAIDLCRPINDNWDLNFGYSSVERAPSVVELFMNGPHLATGRFETGNVNLATETSNNIDIALSYESDNFYATATIFRNDVDNYVYLMDIHDEDDHDDHMGAMSEDDDHDDHDEHGHAEGLIEANYMQQNAELDGYELEIGRIFNLDNGDLEVSFGRDVVNGTLADGMNIPRLSPARNIYSVKYFANDYLFDLSFKDVDDQTDVAEEETPTMGYQMLDTKLVKTFDLNGNSLRVSVFANNLLDEVARNHSSFVKNQVPLPGRNYGIRFNLTF
jgi:iron complex outermembrane receptor protein